MNGEAPPQELLAALARRGPLVAAGLLAAPVDRLDAVAETWERSA